MSQPDLKKDYYEILGADESTTQRELERLYKHLAAQRHPDKGGSEEEMKSLNEAYGVLRNRDTRREYDATRVKPAPAFVAAAASTPAARDVGLLGQGLSAFFCLIVGLFLLLLVHFQWIWFLWPLAILAVLVILFGIVMARGTMRAVNASLPTTNPLRKYAGVQEAIFWSIAMAGGYGVYLLLTSM